jgi:hypothetical protein
MYVASLLGLQECVMIHIKNNDTSNRLIGYTVTFSLFQKDAAFIYLAMILASVW